jgi:hypothetical protein
VIQFPLPVRRERVRVRVISAYENRQQFKITLTQRLSDAYVGEGPERNP